MVKSVDNGALGLGTRQSPLATRHAVAVAQLAGWLPVAGRLQRGCVNGCFGSCMFTIKSGRLHQFVVVLV